MVLMVQDAAGPTTAVRDRSPARRMGTSVKMIDQTYGHLVTGADEYERELLDAFDEGRSGAAGRYLDAEAERDAA